MKSATVYIPPLDGSTGADIVVEGLQSSRVCDEALQCARRNAAGLGRPVFLEDQGVDVEHRYAWVHPDGERIYLTPEEWTAHSGYEIDDEGDE